MISIVKTTKEYMILREKTRGSIGCVPTMGNLHQGHLSLLKRSLEENDLSVFSIFVNPSQFAPGEDFNKYPRTLEKDVEALSKVVKEFPHRKCIIYAPQTVEEIYPENFSTSIKNHELGSILEGDIRPTHFEGVLTVVYLLFKILKPHRAYFGLKDFQQYTLLKKMVTDLQLPIQVMGLPIVRDEKGLALSSRNQYLAPAEQTEALILKSNLEKVAEFYRKNKNIEETRNFAQELIKFDSRWNYLELRDTKNLSKDIRGKEFVILGAIKLKSTRLIDNVLVDV